MATTQKLVTSNFNVHSAASFVNTFANTDYFIFAGKHTPYPVSDSTITIPNNSVQATHFDVYDDIYKVINKTSSVNYNNTAFLDYCLESEETMFLWVYLLQSYIYILQNRYGNYIKLPTLNDCKKLYSIDHLSKDDWGNVTWFILHTSAMYGKGEGDEIFYNYKALLSCLQFLLPCPKCRSHLRDNLAKIDIDYCKSSQLKLFECSWRLHNVVNESLGKYQPTLKEAIAMYSNLNA